MDSFSCEKVIVRTNGASPPKTSSVSPLTGRINEGLFGTMTVLLTLVRHGESTANVEFLESGQTGEGDCGITNTGDLQVRETAKAFAQIRRPVDFVFCSPLERARKTGLEIIDALNGTADAIKCDRPVVEFVDELCEFRRKATAERSAETANEFHARVGSFLDKLKAMGTVEKPVHIVVCGHSLWMSSAISGGSDTIFHSSNCSITEMCFVVDKKSGELTKNVLITGFTGHLSTPTGHHSWWQTNYPLM